MAKLRGALLVFAVLAGAFAAAAFSQSAFNISGTVRDRNGDAIPGAQVLLRSGSRTIETTSTDTQGRFELAGVLHGSYTLLVRLAGFRPFTSVLTVASSAPAPLSVVMTLRAVKQTVTVSSSANRVTPDTSDNLNGVTLKAQQLRNLPVFDEDVIGALSRFLDTDAEGTGGAAIVVNGVPVDNVAVTPSAIQSVKIDNNPFDTQYPRPGWGRMEITTKAGTQQYHGEVNFIFRDAVFNARNAFARTRPPEQRRKFEGTLGGPVLRSKKTSFLISAGHNDDATQSSVYALKPGGTLAENVPTPSRRSQVYARIDHTINDENNFSISAAYRSSDETSQGVGGLTLPEAGYDTSFTSEKLRFNETTIFTPNLLNELHVLVSRYRNPTVSTSNAPQIDVLGAFTGGGAQADELITHNRLALAEVATWSHNKHVVKWGFDIPDWGRRGLDNNQNFGGTYVFSSLADYTAGKPLSYTLQQGDGHLVFWQKMLGAFVQDDYRLKRNITVSAGLRWDWENYFSDTDEFAPRVALAYSPGKSRKTVIRGGAGLFDDRVSWGPASDLLLYNGQRLRKYVVTNPFYPNPFASGVISGAVPPTVYELDPNFHMPYLFLDGVEVERQIGKGATVSATWEDGRTAHAFRSRDLNAPLPPYYAARPDPLLGRLQQYESAGRRQFDSLHLQLRGQLNRYFTGIVRDRCGWSSNDTSGINSFPANQYDLSGEWGRSSWDRRNRFEMLGMFNPGKLFNLGVSVSLYTGAPYDVTLGTDPYNDGLALARPTGVARNSAQGPGYADVDVRWEHDFRIGKKDGSPIFTVAVGAFNVFNTVNYGEIIGNLSSPLFGHAVSASAARRLQFSTRFRF